MKTLNCIATLSLALGAFLPLGAQPVTNPVLDSGIDTGSYDTAWIAALPWASVTQTAAVPNDGTYNADGTIAAGDDLATIQAEIFALSAGGGGVLYFPAGTYDLSGHLYLADGVILRGATPAEGDCRGTFTTTAGGVRTYTLTYDPPTNFKFPVFIQDYASDMRRVAGTKREKFFKQILVGKPDGLGGILPDATAASDYGIVNVDIDGAIISIGDRADTDFEWGTTIPKNLVTGRNILIFGNRLNNGTALAPNVPEQGQNTWQIWPTRTRGKIDVVSAGNTLIANNLVGDKHYKYYVAGDTSQVIMDYTAYLGQSGQPIEKQYRQRNTAGSSMSAPNDIARFSDGYGIRLNHVLDYVTAHTAVQEPSKHRKGQGIINNFHFGTTRVGFMGAGNGLVVKGNAREDLQGVKYEYINEQGTGLITNNSATLENRGIDITGGHDVVAEGNYVRVRRGTFASGYPSVDGEGLLLQESSSTMHPVNWTVRGNTAHSYLGIYRVIYSDGILFDGNTVYNDPIYTDGARNASQGRVGGTVAFKDNTATSVYAKYNIKPRNFSFADLGGNNPAAVATEGGNGGAPAGVALVDAIPGVEILYPTVADMASISAGTQVGLRVRVTRDPADAAGVLGVKVWDGVTNYPANGQMGTGYWDFTGTTTGQPAGVALTLTEPDALTGAIGGGVYTGTWTVPAEFDKRGLLVAEVRLADQTGVTGAWQERAWAFMQPGVAAVAPTITADPAGATVAQGQPFSLSVLVDGTAPFDYQWRKGGVPIEGADSATYTVAAATLADTGSYDVVVTNAAGSATSAAAKVYVTVTLPYPQDFDALTVGELNSQGGWSYTYDGGARLPVAGVRVEAGGLGWTGPDGGVIPAGTQHLYMGARTAEFGNVKMDRWLSHSPVSYAGPVYFRFLMNMGKAVNGTLTDPSELFFGLTSNAAISGAPWDAYLAVKHQNVETNPVIGVETTGSGGIVPVAKVALDTTLLVVGKFEVDAAGLISGVKVWINPAYAGEATPDVNATIATPSKVLAEQTYLKIRAQNMPARVDAILFAQTWDEVVPKPTVVVTPPSIVSDPVGATVFVGDSFSLSVTAEGTAPLYYQWRKGGVDIDGARQSTFTVSAAALEDAGSYDVVVTNGAGSATSAAAEVVVNEIPSGELVPLFTETFDSGADVATKAQVPLTSLGWNLHHSFKGVFMPGLPTGNAAPNDTVIVNTTAELGDQTIGQPYGYQAVFINNTPLYGPGTDGDRPELPGPHPVTGEYYSNRTLAIFLWKEAAISAASRAGIREFNFVQGNRDAQYHQFFPAVRIGGQWFVYRISAEALAAVRVFGRASQYGMYGEESVFTGTQFTPDPNLYYTAQPYKFTWSESGWTPLTFNGGNGTNSTVGMTLGEPLTDKLPAGDITAVGVYSPENIDPDGPSAPGYNFNGHRIDSIQILGLPVATTPDLYTFTFNNEGNVGGLDRPIQAANWNGIYSAAALPLVTGPAVFADLSEGVTDDATPGSYKAGFLFVSGKTDQPAPGGFLVWSEKTSVVDVPQDPVSGANPQTDWYSEPENPVTNLAQLMAKELDTLTMRINPRNAATVRYHFAIKVGGAWYVSQQSFQSTGAWTEASLPVQSASWLAGVVGAGSLNLDFAANPPAVVTIGDIGANKYLDTVGIYIDTDNFTGQTDTWARVDSISLSVKLSSEVIPPTITKQPENVAVLEGNDASFTVEVLEAGVAYQWRKGGVDIDGATSATLTIINATPADAGSYDVVVTGAKGSVTSAPATLTVYPLPTVDPAEFNVDATAQDQLIIVDAVQQVSWTAQSTADWIMVTLGASGSGSDLVQISIAANTDYAPRTGTVLVAYRTVTVNQAGKPLPASFQEAVGGVDQGGGKYASPWFGTFWVAAGTDWIYHADHGWLYTDAVQVPESMWLYSNSLAEWVYTDNTAYPWMYDNGTGHWIYFVVIGNAVYVFDSTTGVWSSGS